MCKFWKREKSNHHFPELNKRQDFRAFLKTCSRPLVAGPILLAIVFIFGFFYSVQTNLNATKGYQIKELEKQLTGLAKENKKLRLSYIELQSMASIIDKSAKLNLVPAGNIEVIATGGLVMALK
jgi:hypothetical protein